MTITKALEVLVQSDVFKEMIKGNSSESAKYRMFHKRYREGILSEHDAFKWLRMHGCNAEITFPHGVIKPPATETQPPKKTNKSK